MYCCQQQKHLIDDYMVRCVVKYEMLVDNNKYTMYAGAKTPMEQQPKQRQCLE